MKLLILYFLLLIPRPLFNEDGLIVMLTEYYTFASIHVQEISVDTNILTNYKVEGRFFKVTDDSIFLGYAYQGKVLTCKNKGCDDPNGEMVNSAYEFLEYRMILSIDKKVEQLDIFNYQSTHGASITNQWWLKQFKGYDGRSIEYGYDIDGVSGATTSGVAFTYNVELVLKIFKEHIK